MQVPIPARIGWFGKNEKTHKICRPFSTMSRGFLFAPVERGLQAASALAIAERFEI